MLINVDKLHKHNTEWQKSLQKKCTQYDFIHIQFEDRQDFVFRNTYICGKAMKKRKK